MLAGKHDDVDSVWDGFLLKEPKVIHRIETPKCGREGQASLGGWRVGTKLLCEAESSVVPGECKILPGSISFLEFLSCSLLYWFPHMPVIYINMCARRYVATSAREA